MFLAFLAQISHSQGLSARVDDVMEEATMLYNSEMASWHGTDLLVARHPKILKNVKGYFSYSDESTHTCLFFSREDEPRVVAQYTFNDNFDLEKVVEDTSVRKFSEKEQNLYEIRNIALDEVNSDAMFKHYDNTNLNLIPIISNKERKVFILTGPKVGGVVIFGNDYLLTFNQKSKLLKKKSLHNNIIVAEYENGNSDSTKQTVAMHSHLKSTGDLITATDVCTLMLYAGFTEWEQYIVVSDKYTSLYDCKKNSLIAIKSDDFKKMLKSEDE